ncbi:MAG: UPF0755 protein [Parcubacteria bacterium C7867-003]|nr:MAG: UPF0755 protein [Parcubacteria bacterium C7867-003]
MIEDLLKKFKALPKRQKYSYIIFVVFFVIFSIYSYLHRPPENFPLNDVITIEEGQSLQDITNTLYNAGVIKFPLVFRSTVILLSAERMVIAGDYLLDKKVGPIDLAYRLIKGQFHMEAKRITIFEGWTIFDIADSLEKQLVDFDKEEFIRIAKSKEGYLFPDTYFINSTARPKSIVNMMGQNFEAKIKTLPGIATSTRSLKEIITMASIIEAETRSKADKSIVSGILWNRININMPLQLDTTFVYINGKNTFELTLADLKIDSPYNTYKYKGLPPGPINNPSMDSIVAALYPAKTKYLFFLTGQDGKMYYGKNFEEHKKNRKLYLDI